MDERSEKRIVARISMSQDFRRKAQVPNLAVIEISQKLEFTNPLMNKKYYPQELGKANSFLLVLQICSGIFDTGVLGEEKGSRNLQHK